jgi:hypothetical protein
MAGRWRGSCFSVLGTNQGPLLAWREHPEAKARAYSAREHAPFERQRSPLKLFRRSEDPPVNSAFLAMYRPIVLLRWQYFLVNYTLSSQV